MKKLSALLLALLLLFSIASCTTTPPPAQSSETSIAITGDETITLTVGETKLLTVETKNLDGALVVWSSSSDCVTVSETGLLSADKVGTAIVSATIGEKSDTLSVTVIEKENNDDTDQGDVGDSNEEYIPEDDPIGPTEDPYVNVTKEEFYQNYTPATSYMDAYYRSQHGFLSGSLTVPGQYAEEAEYRPQKDGYYIKNTSAYYMNDGKTYVVLDAYGNVAMKIYMGGAYITLEEVAAYMYAFGGSSENLPANYTTKKSPKPQNSIWGEYLRANHSYFSGDTIKYPYEPKLPNISGCGGNLQYYEMDIGTTGTETPGYQSVIYNNGTKITRGAARIVYARQDLNKNGIYEVGEIYVFYTHNHYNDFREYLNYYGGWGEMFGNVTGGGEYSSQTNCNPTPYPSVTYESIKMKAPKETAYIFNYSDKKSYTVILLPSLLFNNKL